jgi:ABC-2 type transport system permease protein
MNTKRLKALIKKEALQILRDPSAILIAVVLPLILLFLMGYAVSLDAKKIHIAVISNTENQALFDFDNKALPALYEFRNE